MRHISSKAFSLKRFAFAPRIPGTFFCGARKFPPRRKANPSAKCTCRLSCTPGNIPCRLRCIFAPPSPRLSRNDISNSAPDFLKARPGRFFCPAALRTISALALCCRTLSPNKIPIRERAPRARKCFPCPKIPCEKGFYSSSCQNYSMKTTFKARKRYILCKFGVRIGIKIAYAV